MSFPISIQEVLQAFISPTISVVVDDVISEIIDKVWWDEPTSLLFIKFKKSWRTYVYANVTAEIVAEIRALHDDPAASYGSYIRQNISHKTAIEKHPVLEITEQINDNAKDSD